MSQVTDFPLPPGLPRPVDDGAAAHLAGMRAPEVRLQATSGEWVDLAKLDAPRTVIYCYPMTGVPGQDLPAGWNEIPGARGCTPQSCSFRDQFAVFENLGVKVFGLSTQSTNYQREMVQRLHLPFAVLSDAEFQLTDALHLPAFEVEGKQLLKRLTMVLRDGAIEHVFYPVFPPNESAAETLRWLTAHPIPTCA